MALLINNATGLAANTNLLNLSYPNKDPVFVANNLLTTIYTWATVWGAAQVQIYVSPQRPNSIFPTIWIAMGDPITEDEVYTFQHRWAQIKAVVTNADTTTAGLFCSLYDGI